jgi:hypothetical protein
VLGNDQEEDQEEDGGHFGHADEHGLPSNKPHGPTLPGATRGKSPRDADAYAKPRKVPLIFAMRV